MSIIVYAFCSMCAQQLCYRISYTLCVLVIATLCQNLDRIFYKEFGPVYHAVHTAKKKRKILIFNKKEMSFFVITQPSFISSSFKQNIRIFLFLFFMCTF